MRDLHIAAESDRTAFVPIIDHMNTDALLRLDVLGINVREAKPPSIRVTKIERRSRLDQSSDPGDAAHRSVALPPDAKFRPWPVGASRQLWPDPSKSLC